MTEKTMPIQDPWFTHIRKGAKTVEGRLAGGFFGNLKKGDIVTVIGPKRQTVMVEIIDTIKYKTFAEMLETEGLDKVLPGINTIDEGVAVYRQWYSEDREKQRGVAAIRIKIISDTDRSTDDQDAGYYRKYLKYKAKYLALRSSV